MAQIDFRKKINWHRRYRSPQGVKTEHEILRIFESDRGRIINSPAIRRLQQKTQVFPLERNAAVRTRLTHSMEVQQVGRYIAKEVLSRLKEMKLLAQYGLDELTGPFESIVEMSCLMHDIGNPPFGHFGEAAINDWFRQRLHPADAESQPLTEDRCKVASLRLREGEESLNDLRRKVRQDLCHFEGNAQGIRLVQTLMRMNLTWAQVGGILKYTRPAWWRGETPATHNYLMKKPGYYLSEESYIARLRRELDLALYSRFPLTWIMEAADDISYCVADLEDAVEKRIFSAEQLYHHLQEAWGVHEKGSLFALVVENAWEKSRANTLSRSTEDQFFMYLRVNTLNKLVPYAAQRFIDNLEQIFAGTFNQALLEDGSSFSRLLKLYKNVAIKHVFSHPEVEQLELQGYRVISGLLDIYRPLLSLPLADFSELVEKERLMRFPIESRLFQKLSTRHRLAYIEAVSKLAPDSLEYPVMEYYYRCRLIQDYISGMTDLYAWDEYRRLMAVEQ
ncbi:dGTPase [Citrobacter rodentium]|uniref:Deoxyguanosinetriphosphate triphosphohydrolase n=2 Tax=Citrobacter rodentium TaxID=67825 RepID=D2TI48_CITRI|nr:dGTPase [Citrobacter rodentium]KIQ50653.1 deoxyguanosinetriphosphate triphosphohydrolase [Citrobacter rodentium]QBY31415.1 dGTPase [Citrobacter rodentium]UHO31222.1 dGTPase [Citrobacter rodentium NBRC 105723 = DSM 16636]CBG86944.1 deoxyguanosinetriphosphate triphosphohydrolase [Citrobacter rodentium ICC168]HAT8013641.1 deoxyguanosinetriphosphate triphosphohydrolase [Citrobacter rodentium NBRC 105723 = DSM 16636]